MSALSIDPVKMDELFKKIDSKKKLEEMLLDPRVIELSKKSPQSKQALAAIVRRLQEERERKRRVRNNEVKEEISPVPRWFDCMNFMKSFAIIQRHGEPRRSTEHLSRPRSKLTVSTPNLESASRPDVPFSEGCISSRQLSASSQSIDVKDMSLCLSQTSRDTSIPMNLLDFCTSERGKAMISTLIKNTDLKDLFGLKTSRLSRRSKIVKYLDTYNCSDLKCVHYLTVPTNWGQVTLVLRTKKPGTLNRIMMSPKNLVTSGTQTTLSGSCSLCSSSCESSDSYPSCNDTLSRRSIPSDHKYKNIIEVSERMVKDIPGFSSAFRYNSTNQLSKCNNKKNIMKTSKSQSAMYSTEYSECDCDNLSVDEISGGKYLSKILTNAGAPTANYLTTPDVLVSYSEGQHSSDTESSSSCEACRRLGNISSESVNRQPSEIWTQKRLKTSCESCITSFRTEYIRKSSYCNRPSRYNLSDDSLSYSDDCLETSNIDRTEGQQNKVMDVYNCGEIEETDTKISRSILDVAQNSVNNELTLVAANVNDNTNTLTIRNQMRLNDSELDKVPSTKCHEEEPVAIKPEITNSECAFDLREQYRSHAIITSTVHDMETLSRNTVGDDSTVRQEDGQLTKKLLPDVDFERDRMKSNLKSNFANPCENDESFNSDTHRYRKLNKRVRNKSVFEEPPSSSSSNTSIPQVRPYPRRTKTTAGPCVDPAVKSLPQKVTKERSRHKNCVVM